MERKTFELIDAICREGLTNDVWGVIENGNTADWFGDSVSRELHGQYLYVYNETDDRQEIRLSLSNRIMSSMIRMGR